MRKKINKMLSAYNSIELGINITISINDYVDKILNNSTIVPYFMQGDLKGFISYYNNDASKQHSFLTMILISKEYQGKGIGKLLLELSINDLKKSGFVHYSLEVLKTNEKAINLYSNYGFYKKEDRGELWLMEKILN